MFADILTRLQAAASDEEREWLLLEMVLAQLEPEVQTAVVTAAAIPHWFDLPYLAVILGITPEELTGFGNLTALSFVEIFPGRGYNIHERTRHLLLNRLWQDEPDRFRELSARAAAYCAQQDLQNADWRIEWIYHLLVSQPETGIEQLRTTGLQWRNFPYNAYDQVENLARVAREHAGRQPGQQAGWGVFWQAQLDVLYGREAEARQRLEQLVVDPTQDLNLAAERSRAMAALYEQAGQVDEAQAAYRQAVAQFRELGQPQTALILEQSLPDKGGPAVHEKPITPALPPQKPSKNRQTLLDNIKTVWIDGVLNQSLQHEIALAMQQEPEMVGQAVSMTLHSTGQMDQTIPAGMSIQQLFEQSGRSLLILGDPGSGKTITLLQLLRALHEQATADTNAPIPLLFNLSSWGRPQTDLAEWLVEEAFLQYQLSRKFMREEFLPTGNYILLLDGLDEVPIQQRNDCVAAINSYLAKQPRDVVVCSRIADYQALETTLQLGEAILLRPLNEGQITQFLEQAAPDEQAFGALRQLLETDRQVGQMARSPLLLNIMMLTYQGAEAISLAEHESVEEKRRHLFASYIQKALARPPLGAEGYSRAQVMRWLTYLAQSMKQEGKSLFYLEEMQPTRLGRWPGRAYRALYGGASGLIVGLIFGLVGGLIMELSNRLSYGLIGGLIGRLNHWVAFGLISMFSMAFSTIVSHHIGHPRVRFLVTAVMSWLIFSLINQLIVAQTGVQTVSIDDTMSDFLFSSQLTMGMVLLVSGGVNGWQQAILVRERLGFQRPSSSRLLSSLISGVGYGLLVGLLVGLIFGLISGMLSGLIVGLPSGLIVGLFSGLSDGLLFGLGFGFFGLELGVQVGFLAGSVLAFFDAPLVDRRLQPGQGVRRSLRNGFFMLILAAFVLGSIGLLLDVVFIGEVILNSLALAAFLPAAFLYYGGLAFFQHYSLRLVLARQKRLPFRLVPFLDAMTRRVLLRRIGGGYIFIHRSLLEHFASLAPHPPEKS